MTMPARFRSAASSRYDCGVLTLRIPVAEKAKPRKIEITQSTDDRHVINA
jgi:HSP20 family protein